MAAVAAIFRPAAAVLVLAGVAYTAASLLPARRPVPRSVAASSRRVEPAKLVEVGAFIPHSDHKAPNASVKRLPVRDLAPRPAEPPPASGPAPPPAAERPRLPSAGGDGLAGAYRQGCQLERAGDVRAAEEAFAAATASGDRLAALSLGQLLQARGQVDEAASCFRRAAEGTDSLAATAALSLGVLLASRGNQRAAAAAYERAVRCGGGAGESAALLLRWLQRRRKAA
jgi:tetratricopeptide (TPR) repeat protein